MKKIETEKKASKRAAKLIADVKPTELEIVTGGGLPRGCPTCGLGQTGI